MVAYGGDYYMKIKKVLQLHMILKIYSSDVLTLPRGTPTRPPPKGDGTPSGLEQLICMNFMLKMDKESNF
jgi:hypothetical protein